MNNQTLNFRDTNGFEIDFIAEWDKTIAIEVKSDDKSEKKMSANLKKYISLRKDTCGKVHYLGDITAEIGRFQLTSKRIYRYFLFH